LEREQTVINSDNPGGMPAMTVKIEKLERVFLFNGVKLPDPSPDFTVEQVRDTYVNTYPELATAAIEGPSPVDGTMQYVFSRAVGAKG
jgi:PRTRC genetic system protein C